MFGMSVNDVPGWLVAIAPSGIGVPVAFWPVPSPHFRAADCADVVELVLGLVLAPLPLPLLPQAASANEAANARLSAAIGLFLLTAPSSS